MVKEDNHVFVGMSRDNSVSKVGNNYMFDAKNIRVTAVNNETSLSITNERGPAYLQLTKGTIEGTLLGHAVMNKYLILFTKTADSDKIYRVDIQKLICVELFSGDLNFNLNYPIETLTSYENENIQKVYWTDNYNQPRVINIAEFKDDQISKYNNGSFDFVPYLQLQEKISIEKQTGAEGVFAPGTIQYAFTYYNKYGQESNIFYITPIYYTSHADRAGAKDETVANSFQITVENLDSNFEYLRIYSIQRTSLNATPICKNVQDISIKGTDKITFVDNGTQGSDISATTLLYVGGEEILAETMTQKDGTLFLGNITIQRKELSDSIVTKLHDIYGTSQTDPNNENTQKKFKSVENKVYCSIVGEGDFIRLNTLNTNAQEFKAREYYRLGIQCQYKNGKWSAPVWLGDYQVTRNPTYDENQGYLGLNAIQTTITDADLLSTIKQEGYKKIRPVVVFPNNYDRTILCQGIENPTVYTDTKRKGLVQDAYGNLTETSCVLNAQASWLFRPVHTLDDKSSWKEPNGGGYVTYKGYLKSQFNQDYILNADGTYILDPYIRSTEIEGIFNEENQFQIDQSLVTINSPDLCFDTSFSDIDWSSQFSYNIVGSVIFKKSYGDIDIQYTGELIAPLKPGFYHKTMEQSGAASLISGGFFRDGVVDDFSDNTYGLYGSESSAGPFWPVYMWHKNGSLNNDVSRTGQTSVLSQKVISNYKVCSTIFHSKNIKYPLLEIDFFNSDEVSIVKLNNKPYMGNIDTLLVPDGYSPKYLIGNFYNIDHALYNTTEYYYRGRRQNWGGVSFYDPCYYKLQNIPKINAYGEITYTHGLYKRFSGYSWVYDTNDVGDYSTELTFTKEPIRMKYKSTPHLVVQLNNGVTKQGHFDNSLGLVEISRPYIKETMFGGSTDDALEKDLWLVAGEPVEISNDSVQILYTKGDTYFQRYECLKTYPFTTSDINQVIEIASFFVETRVNLDGRYDRNRADRSNLTITNTNFNLMNDVYSQKDNYFEYSIFDEDYYKINQFANQITWTLEKVSGSEVDTWTDITLASTYDVDGELGEITSLNVWNSNIFCFQTNGISNILFNSRVQIPTNDNAPIEIGNSYKLEGKRYISRVNGCYNKYSIAETASGIYFIDSVSKDLYSVADKLLDISLTKGMNTWFSGLKNRKWTPNFFTERVFHDSIKNDLYIVTKDECLNFSERLSEFISFLSYEGLPLMEDIQDNFYCMRNHSLYKMFAGQYNNFFGYKEDYYLTFICNGGEFKNYDKIFDNLEFRADKYNSTLDSANNSRPFDTIQVWDEYQDTNSIALDNILHRPSDLKKKFRQWRVQIPRNYGTRDRIRNNWCKIKLQGNNIDNDNYEMQLHDVTVKYFV